MNEAFMKERPVLPLLLSMALPMVLSMLVNSLYTIVDSLFVAQISEDAMTALSLVYPIQNLINAGGIGFGVGINAVIAFHLGAGAQDKADMAATQGLVFSLVHAAVLTVGGIALMPTFLQMFTSSKEVISLGTRYSTVAFAFTPMVMAGLVFEKLFQSVGYVYNTASLGSQILNNAEQIIYFLCCQCGCGFIHDQDSRIDRQCFGNFDHLLFGYRQFSHDLLRVNIDLQII